jgi:hypothetical protein
MLDREALEKNLQALLDARAGATKVVEFRSGNGSMRRVEYKTDQELAAAIADIERRLAMLAGRTHTIQFSTSKGL